MMNWLRERIWGAALSMPSLNDLIDKALDWIEGPGVPMVPPAMDGLIYDEVRIRVPRD